jgi:hypothetical protein
MKRMAQLQEINLSNYGYIIIINYYTDLASVTHYFYCNNGNLLDCPQNLSKLPLILFLFTELGTPNVF